MVTKMSEIQINLKKLEEQISQLRVLNENLKASVTISPTCSGGGKSVTTWAKDSLKGVFN